MIRFILIKFFILSVMFMPQILQIVLQMTSDNSVHFHFTSENLLYTSIMLSAVSLNSQLNLDLRVSKGILFMTMVSMLIVSFCSLTLLLIQLNKLNANQVAGKQNISTLIVFCLALSNYFFTDYIQIKFKSRVAIEVKEEYKIELSILAKYFISFIKSMPKKLLISALVTLILYIVFHYDNTMINHLGVCGGIIGIISLYDEKKNIPKSKASE